jgi:hypothetical protein
MVLRPSPRPSVLALSRTRSRGRRCHFWCSISPTPRRGRDASRGPVDPPHPVRRAPAGALIDRVDKRQLLTACDISGVARTSCWAPSRCFVASPPPRRRAIPDGGTLALGGFAIGRRRRREREVDRRARPPAGPRRLLPAMACRRGIERSGVRGRVRLAIASAAVATFTPLRDYAVREPRADEV